MHALPATALLRQASEHSIHLQVCNAAFEEQLLLITAGSRATIRFLPPLSITSAEVDEALGKLERAIGKVFDPVVRLPSHHAGAAETQPDKAQPVAA